MGVDNGKLTRNKQAREKVLTDIRQGLREEFGVELDIDSIKFVLSTQRKAMAYCISRQLDFRIPEVGNMRFSERKADEQGVELIGKRKTKPQVKLGGLILNFDVVKREHSGKASKSTNQSGDVERTG